VTRTYIDASVLIAAARGQAPQAQKAMDLLDDPERESGRRCCRWRRRADHSGRSQQAHPQNQQPQSANHPAARVAWVIDQYQVTEDPRSGIRLDPNRPDDPEYITRLLAQLIRLSLDTLSLIRSLPGWSPPVPSTPLLFHPFSSVSCANVDERPAHERAKISCGTCR